MAWRATLFLIFVGISGKLGDLCFSNSSKIIIAPNPVACYLFQNMTTGIPALKFETLSWNIEYKYHDKLLTFKLSIFVINDICLDSECATKKRLMHELAIKDEQTMKVIQLI